MRPDRRRPGSALIEVLVALVLLSVAGTGLVTLLGQTRHSMESLASAEALTSAASDELGAVSTLSRDALLARVGTLPWHSWSLTINRIGDALFEARISESSGRAAVLVTTLYRPDTVHVSVR